MKNFNEFDHVYVIDFGKNTATISHNGQDCRVVSHAEVFSLHETLPKDSLVICEYAHLGCPRQEYSLSQPFTETELHTLYENFAKNRIVLKLFPQKSMPRASSYSNIDKGDMYDPIAIYNLLKDFPSISLMNPPISFRVLEGSKRHEYWEWKKVLNQILNAARMDKYDLARTRGDKNTDWLLENLQYIYENLSAEARSCFGFEIYKKTGKLKVNTKNDWNFSMPQLYSILSILRDYHGTLRKRESTGNFPSNNDAYRYILCMTPFHFRGGVARSTLFYHGLMNWVISQAAKVGINLKRKIKTVDKDGKESTRRIRRGHFTPEEEAVYHSNRLIYVRSIREAYKLFKYMLSDNFDPTVSFKEQKEKQLELVLN